MSKPQIATRMPYEPSLADRIVHTIDNCDLERFLQIASRFGTSRFGYVVTPNVDHMIRYHENEEFRTIYAHASYVLMDSRFAAMLLRFVRGVKLPVCTGSDLTSNLLDRVVSPDDRIVLLGSSPGQARLLEQRYGLKDLRHHNPPMGFENDPAAVEECLRFIEAASPFRFCIMAVGTPRQERLALQLQARGVARGLVLNTGASINFITGVERRAPRWMQRLGIEWLYRLLHAPRRLGYRYLVRGPRFFAYMLVERVILREPQA